MYRIEVKPGEETVFRTIEELATGIRNGFITPRARIFHAASQKWLPIEFHPHYKKALEGDYTPAPVVSPPSLSAFPTPVLTPVPTRTPAPHASPVMAMRAEVESRGLAPAAAPAPAHTADEPEEPAEPAREEKSHVAVALLEPPRPMPAPEVVLPNITYPELPPAPEPQHRPAVRRGRRVTGRPVLLIGAAAALVFGAHRLIGARTAGSDVEPAIVESEAADAPAPRAPRPNPTPVQASPPVAEVPARGSAPAPAPAPAPHPPAVTKSVTPTPPVEPMTPGPAFAASVPTRVARMPASPPTPAPVVRPTAEQPAPAVTPAPAPEGAAPALEPAPAAIDLDLPALPVSDSLSQLNRSRTDSVALKRILKAVSGKKGGSPAQ